MTDRQVGDKVEDLRQALLDLLSPFGWHVWSTRPPLRTGYEPYTLHFELTPNQNSWLKDQRWVSTYTLSYDLKYMLSDAKYWEWLPMQIARQTMDQLMGKLNQVRKPQAGELDWRSNEVTPEDFYAM